MDDGPVPRSFKGHTCTQKSVKSTLYMASKPIRTQDQDVSEYSFNQISKTSITSTEFGATALTLEKEESG